MVTALIFAGGTGVRMNSKAKPKQFLELYGKPILIHTIEYFQQHGEIDNIVVVCIESWFDELKELIRKYMLTKVKWIVPGGATGQESIYNGLACLVDDCTDDDDIVLIHDGVRPLISEELITENIKAVKKYRTAITVSSATESIISVENDHIDKVFNRNKMRVAKAPQTFYYKDIWSVHQMAKKGNICAIDSSELMSYYGYKLHTVESTPYNIKITSPSDFYIFRAIYEARENSQIFGL